MDILLFDAFLCSYYDDTQWKLIKLTGKQAFSNDSYELYGNISFSYACFEVCI